MYFTIFIFCSQLTFSQDLKPEYQKFVKSFIANVKANNREGVSKFISFPLKRDYPIPEVKNKADFIKRYDQIFDATLKNGIIKSNPAKDWEEVGWRGIMLYSGTLWIDTNGKVIAVNYQSKFENDLKNKLVVAEKSKLHPSIAKFETPVCILETSKFRIRIDDLGNDNYRYASWSIKKPMSEEPDLVITNGKWVADGSGGNSHYDFKKEVYVYECYIIKMGEDGSPPAILTIYQGDKVILEQDAKIVPR
ncbi:hypothetical protein [uncultured Flavobacterium sp.]|uniref:hypothetical protein n=1 Tax=uncultured Flavobacterium sp. TaxID=165435 RepID=UPI0029305BEF|nr:hypothetical protein [uncultured Flavobacterium sp.]